jgi:FkbH-like protein
MDFYIYRNFTAENLFKDLKAEYSGYGDISFVPKNCNSYIWFYLPSINMNYQELSQEVQDFQTRFQLLLSKIPNDKTIIALTAEVFFSLKAINSSFDLTSILGDYNNFLNELSVIRPNLKVIDFKEFYNLTGEDIFNWRYYYISQSLINPKYNKQFNSWFKAKLDAISNNRKKCLVLDLDNTLWGGILGEDGIEGIQLGNLYPGLAFYDFQKGLLELYNSGVILAVCSKNNELDVLECWSKHPSILINKKHLSSYRINWVDKPTNIRAIANELNISLDSIVFIDDNPAERERVKFELPMVSVPDFPEQPYLLCDFLKSVHFEYFQIHQLTSEDQKKTEQYKTNVKRKVFSEKFKNIDDYLSSLKMELNFFDCNELNILRISQMTQKTNQFNLTTKRYIEQDLINIKKNNGLINCLSVKDRFGDNGITVASVILIDKHIASIDSFLLSCRILGRGIEEAYLLFLLNNLVKMGITTVEAKYIPTKKNIQTSEFYENQGFKLIKTEESGIKIYSLELIKINKIKEYYKFTS